MIFVKNHTGNNFASTWLIGNSKILLIFSPYCFHFAALCLYTLQIYNNSCLFVLITVVCFFREIVAVHQRLFRGFSCRQYILIVPVAVLTQLPEIGVVMNFDHLRIQFPIFQKLTIFADIPKYSSNFYPDKGIHSSFIFYIYLFHHFLSRIHMIRPYIIFLYGIFVRGHGQQIYCIFRYIPGSQRSTACKQQYCHHSYADTCALMLLHGISSFLISSHCRGLFPARFLL